MIKSDWTLKNHTLFSLGSYVLVSFDGILAHLKQKLRWVFLLKILFIVIQCLKYYLLQILFTLQADLTQCNLVFKKMIS